MKKLLLALCFSSFAFGEVEQPIPDRAVTPYGFNLELGQQIIAFVDPSCLSCAVLSRDLKELNVTYIARTSMPKTLYPVQITDKSSVFHEIFRVSQFPSVFLLENGIEIKQFGAGVRTADIKQAALLAVKQPPLSLGFALGSRPGGVLRTHTGPVVFWRSSCPSCQREKAALVRLCARPVQPLIVYSTRQEQELLPKGCKGGFNRDLALALGVPVVPAALYFKNGVLVWFRLGYFERLERVIELLAATK